MRRRIMVIVAVLIVLSILILACGPTPEPAQVVVTKEVEVKETVIVAGTPEIVEKEVTTVVEVEKLVVATPTPAASPPESTTFIYGLDSEPDTLDPITFNVGSARSLIRNMYEGLTDVWGEEEHVQPGLATHWDISDDGMEYTFYLREGINFHDGTPFNAEAVKFCLEKHKEAKQYFYVYIRHIDHVEVIDDYTAKVVMEDPFAPIIEGLQWFPIFSPTAFQQNEVDGDYAKAWFAENSAGTGPYKLQQWDRGEQVIIVKNEDYWQGWEGEHVDKVIARVIAEPSTQRLLLEQGDLDLIQKVDVDSVEALQTNPDINMQVYPTSRIFSVMMNVQKGPTADKRVREAIAYAIDYDAHNEGSMRGYVGEHLAGPFPLDLIGGVEDLPVRRRDIEKAKQLLAEAGYPGGGFTLEMPYLGSLFDEHNRIAALLYNNLAEIGIELITHDMPIPTWIETMANPDTAMPLWLHYASAYAPVPDKYVFYLYHTDAQGKAGNNWSYYSNPDVDRLIDAAAASTDHAERMDMFEEIAQTIEEDCVAARLNRTVAFEAARTWVQGWIPRPYMVYMQKFYEIHLEGKPAEG